MLNRFDFSFLRTAAVIGVVLSAAFLVTAQNKESSHDRKEKEHALEDTRNAVNVLREIMSKPDKAIPSTLLAKADAIGIFPKVVKAAFLVGGRGGDGLIVRRMPDGSWGTPVFYNIGGASFGPQVGVKETDYIMLFMDDISLKKLLADRVEIGADASFAAGPIGRTAGAETNLSLDTGILTYSRSKGAFIGASLKGSVLSPDNDANEAFYGMKASRVLAEPESAKVTPVPEEFSNLKSALSGYDH